MEADVVVSWFADVPQSARTAFTRPTKFISLPIPQGRKYTDAVQALGVNPVEGAIKKYGGGVTPLRVALLGFSEGCSGLSQLLSSADGGRVDSVLAIDGIHAGLNAQSMKPWFEFAKLAMVSEGMFVDSYSSVKPPGYPSTTQTADWLWSTLDPGSDGGQPFVSPALPPLVSPATTVKSNALPGIPSVVVEYPTIPWKLQRRANGLILLGLKNNHPPGVADHQYQAKVMLPLVVRELLADRWNKLDPSQGSV